MYEFNRNNDGTLTFPKPIAIDDLWKVAEHLYAERVYGPQIASPEDIQKYLAARIGANASEQFLVVFLTNQHKIIATEAMFFGSIDQCTVHPREIVKRCLHHNAAAVIFAHNHPSGITKPSQADIELTRKLKDVLSQIDVRVLDHIVVAGTTTSSMAVLGLC